MSTETVQAQEIAAGTYTLDPAHSFARFEVRHAGISTFRGGFDEIEARLEGGEKPRLEGAVKVASIDVADEGIKGHLLTDDFFKAEQYPEIRFNSTELVAGADGELTVRGELTIAGATREVEAHGRYAAADFGVAEKVGVSIEATIDRSDYGLDWQMELPSGGNALDYDVKLVVELEFAKDGE